MTYFVDGGIIDWGRPVYGTSGDAPQPTGTYERLRKHHYSAHEHQIIWWESWGSGGDVPPTPPETATSAGGGKTKPSQLRYWYETAEKPTVRTKRVKERLPDISPVPFRTAMEIALEGLEINVPLVEEQAKRYVERHNAETAEQAKRIAKQREIEIETEYENEMAAIIAAVIAASEDDY